VRVVAPHSHPNKREEVSGGFSSSHGSARGSRKSPKDLGMRRGAGNSSIIRRVPEGTYRQGKTLVAHVMHHKPNYSHFQCLEGLGQTREWTRGAVVVVKTKINDVQPSLMDAWPCGSGGPTCPTCPHIVFERLRDLCSVQLNYI